MHRGTVFSGITLGAVITLGLFLALTPVARPWSAAAQELPGGDSARVVTVIATGQARGQPDQATLRLGAEAVQPSADAAIAQANGALQNVLTTLDQQGIPRSDVQTSAVSLMAVREGPNQPGGGEPQITGYRAVNSLSVRVTDITRVGAVLDAAVAGGANQVLGIEFGLGDPSMLHERALQDAVQQARSEAEAVATPLNLQVGQVVGVEEVNPTDGNRPPTPYAAAQSTPIEPGQLQVEAEVRVTFDASTVAPAS